MCKTILITGGAGFIGSCLVRQLISETSQSRVVNLDRLTYAGNLDSLGKVLHHPRHTFVRGDVTDGKLLLICSSVIGPMRCCTWRPESQRSLNRWPGAFVQTNIVGTYTMLDAARKYWSALATAEQQRFRFLHVSTDEVYGSLGPTGAFSETTPYSPRSPYSASKAAADHLVRSYHATYGLPTLVTNTCNNFGPYQFPEKLIPLMVLNAIEGKPLPVYGDGLQVRDWLCVDEHCRCGWFWNGPRRAERTTLAPIASVQIYSSSSVCAISSTISGQVGRLAPAAS